MWSGAMVRCHSWVPLLGCTRWPIGRANRQGATVVGCRCWVPLLGGGVHTVRPAPAPAKPAVRPAVDTTLLRYSSYCFQLLQLLYSSCSSYATLKYAINCQLFYSLATLWRGHVGCHCWGAIAWVPLVGAIAECHCWVPC